MHTANDKSIVEFLSQIYSQAAWCILVPRQLKPFLANELSRRQSKLVKPSETNGHYKLIKHDDSRFRRE